MQSKFDTTDQTRALLPEWDYVLLASGMEQERLKTGMEYVEFLVEKLT